MTIGRLEVWWNWSHSGRPNLAVVPEDVFVTPLRPGWLPGVWRVNINRGEATLWIVGPLRILWKRKDLAHG